MYNAMKILINKKFYKTKEAAQKKLDVFYSVDRLTDDQYIELSGLVSEVYDADQAK